MVTEVLLRKSDFQLKLQVEDAIHHFHDIFVRKVTVKNTAEKEREVRLFFSHDLHLADTDKGVTAYYDPKTDAIVDFRKDRCFSISG